MPQSPLAWQIVLFQGVMLLVSGFVCADPWLLPESLSVLTSTWHESLCQSSSSYSRRVVRPRLLLDGLEGRLPLEL